MALLDVQDLKTHFHTPRGQVHAVDGISFTLEQGETLGIVGESGCGKSVTARTLMGILPSFARVDGQIQYAGQDMRALSEKQLRAMRGPELAMVFQDPMTSLNPTHKVGKQIGESLRKHLGMSKSEARHRAIELLQEVGIPQPDQRVDVHPHELSGGMRQRVAIAISLACAPKLLIADEPTTALDVTIQAEILDLLQRQQRDRQMAMILITHDLGVVAGRCDKVAVMYAGRVVEAAPVKELFRNPRMPYTRALLDSIPRLDGEAHARLNTIAGRPPDLIAPPAGCRFAARCAHARAECTQSDPRLWVGNASSSHQFACHYPLGQDEVSA
jgi:peptide/nickel transport system ATP-binding protein